MDFIFDSLAHYQIKLNYDLSFNIIKKDKQINKNKDFKLIAYYMIHKIDCLGYRLIDSNLKVITLMTDTIINKNSIKAAKSADILIHESTYQEDRKQIALENFHVTVKEAILIAKKANVKRLILTHFSPSMCDDFLGTLSFNGEKCVTFDKILRIT